MSTTHFSPVELGELVGLMVNRTARHYPALRASLNGDRRSGVTGGQALAVWMGTNGYGAAVADAVTAYAAANTAAYAAAYGEACDAPTSVEQAIDMEVAAAIGRGFPLGGESIHKVRERAMSRALLLRYNLDDCATREALDFACMALESVVFDARDRMSTNVTM